MNIRLLRRVQKHILAEPRRYDQGTFGETGLDTTDKSVPKCGTQACIAGWAVILGDKLENRTKNPQLGHSLWMNAAKKAKKLLGLTDEQADRLFADYGADGAFREGGWPEKFWNRYQSAKSARGRARAGFDRIEHFIKTKGAE